MTLRRVHSNGLAKYLALVESNGTLVSTARITGIPYARSLRIANGSEPRASEAALLVRFGIAVEDWASQTRPER